MQVRINYRNWIFKNDSLKTIIFLIDYYRPDLCAVECKIPPKDFLGKFYTDSLVHDQRSLDLLVDVIGEVNEFLLFNMVDIFLKNYIFSLIIFVFFNKDNVILGSDYPFPLGELYPPGGVIENSKLDEQIKENLLYNNGMRFLGF